MTLILECIRHIMVTLAVCMWRHVQVETLRADNTFVNEQMANCKGIMSFIP